MDYTANLCRLCLVAMIVGIPGCSDRDAIAALGSDSDRERREAIAELARGRSRDAVPSLVAVMKTDHLEEVRRDAARALGDIGDRRATLALVDTMAGFDSLRVRSAALMSLEDLADPVSVPPLIAIGRRTEGDNATGVIQVGAADVLGNLPDIAFDQLVNALADSHWKVRWMAVSALGDIGGLRAREALIPHLDDPNGSVRTMARISLDRLDSRKTESGSSTRPR